MSSDLFDLSGRVALVVGASRGIGRGIAQGLAAAGASVALCGRTQTDLHQAAEEIRGLGARAEIFTADVSRVTEIQAMVRDVSARMGQIDILVNVAGINRRKPSTEITEEDWDAVIGLNLKGLFFTCRPSGDIGSRPGALPLRVIEERARSSISAASPARWVFATSLPMRRARGACSE